MVLALLRVLAVLALDGDVPHRIHSTHLKPGATYHLDEVRASGSGPFCFAVLEERGHAEPNRAIGLGCYGGGDASMTFHEQPVRGAPGAAYSVVLFQREPAPVTVIFHLDITKEQP